MEVIVMFTIMWLHTLKPANIVDWLDIVKAKKNLPHFLRIYINEFLVCYKWYQSPSYNTWTFMGRAQINRYKLDKIIIGWLQIMKKINKVNIGEDFLSRTTSHLYSKGWTVSI